MRIPRLIPAMWAITLSVTGVAAEGALHLGAYPHHSLLQMERFYAPLAAYLGEKLDRPVRFGTSSSVRRFEDRVRRRDFDLVFLGPLQYARWARPAGYRPLVRLSGRMRLVFVVSAESEVRSLTDLSGRDLVVPPDEGISVLARQALKEAGLVVGEDVAMRVVAQHNACLRHVMADRAAACAVVEQSLRFVGAREGVDYRVVASSQTLPSALFAVGPDVSAGEREEMRRALIDWPQEAVQRGALPSADWLGYEPASDADYSDPVDRAVATVPTQPGRRR